MAASFNGLNIFDSAVIMTTRSRPAQVQTNAYPMINGLEMVNLGARGRQTEVEGYLTGNSIEAVAARATEWRNLMESAITGPLVTTDGTRFPYVYIAAFQEAERLLSAAGGGFLRHYTATFIHLV